jgi:hypothetical protein
MAGVFCAEHVRLSEAEDPRADDDVVPCCLACLCARGLLTGGHGHAPSA